MKKFIEIFWNNLKTLENIIMNNITEIIQKKSKIMSYSTKIFCFFNNK